MKLDNTRKHPSAALLMIGDIIGEAGMAALEARLKKIQADCHADLTVVNGENAADGFGMTEACARRIFNAGADVITSGNHVWEKRDFWPYMEQEERMLRPANYNISAGRGFTFFEKAGLSWLVVNMQGREYMMPVDCPFKTFDAIAEQTHSDSPLMTVVDFHAESGAEKEAFAFHLDGRAACVAGTHTHIQTADERILPGGTAFIADLGMTGVLDSIIGMDKEKCLERAQKQVPYRLECARGAASIQGIVCTIDRITGKALAITRFSCFA